MLSEGISKVVPGKVLTEADEIRVALAEYEAAGSEEKTAELRTAWELLVGYLEG
jgi:hypothetical protein